MKAPLKTILKNFLDHVEDLEARKMLFDDQYETEFQELKKLTDKLKEDPAYTCSLGLKDVNRPKNRYKDIVPYDFSRVILPKYEGVPGSDYINASYVKGASGAFAYIAAQGPLPNTVMDFWRMIWVCDVQVVVMACNEKEAGKFKCEMYWPSSGEIKRYGNISIELIDTSQVCADFLVRRFLVQCDKEMRDVYQFHYTSWPDHGVPDSVQPILDLVRLMRDCQATETVPIVVHCSAGCGRTGTICAVDYVWACLRQGKLDEDFSLYHISLELRRQRIAMIQTKEQYVLAHKAVAAMFEQQLKVIDCHIYENIDEDGEPLMWKEVVKGNIRSGSNAKPSAKNKSEITSSVIKKTELPLESNHNASFPAIINKSEKVEASNTDIASQNSSVGNNLNMKINDGINSSKNSESSYSRNSILSQQSNDDSIPFIDDDDVCIRPNCGRAYLDMPNCDTISKLMNCFDPFVDKVSLGTDDSSPEGDPLEINKKMKDFQLPSSSKTLNRNTKFQEGKTSGENTFEKLDSRSDIIDCRGNIKKQSLLSNRESYPPCFNNDKFQKNLTNTIEDVGEDIKGTKKVGKATVVRRPSISKLKALFEKSGVSSQKNSDGPKRLLFRNNSQHVSRAGSAPPSLNCMDRNSAVEKESILMMVTRKFRSSSVRSEREQSKQHSKTLNRRSATDAFKDGFNALTRTMSFNINKTFKSYSPSKTKIDISKNNSSINPSENVMGVYIPKSPDQQKGNTMWYDKSSLPRAVAIVKPTGNFDVAPKLPSKSPSAPKTPEKNKSHEPHFNYVSRPTKLRDFFSSLNKKDAKDSSTLWYSESSTHSQAKTEKSISESSVNSDNTNVLTKSTSKVLPFLPISSWKKVSPKNSLSSPDSPKNLNEISLQPNSKFYTNVGVDLPVVVDLPVEKQSMADVPKCPVPEEIIPLNLNPTANKFWPSSSVSSSSSESVKQENIINSKENIPVQIETESTKNESNKITAITDTVSEKNESSKITVKTDVPPAIPKKMIIGKNKNLHAGVTDNIETSASSQPATNDVENISSIVNLSSEKEINSDIHEEKSDLYINVNIKAIKNLEQIENTLRKNPRGAIIDLTSRESYSMEDELVSAVNQLSKSNKDKSSSISSELDENKTSVLKSYSKFPGYEVIWPEHQGPTSVQKSKSSSKVPHNKNNLIEKSSDNSFLNQNKTGLCYSPPLRRSVNASLALAKSQSCSNIDWLEPNDHNIALKEPLSTPTKRLVNEAVVELNTLLNQLTTRTLSEDVGFDSKSKENVLTNEKVADKIKEKAETPNMVQNDTMVHSVTLVTKSYQSGSSPKEEEIVFHFPPPPRGPPPKDESPVESFDIVCKGGSLVVKEVSKPDHTFDKSVSATIDKDSKGNIKKITTEFPQPTPRKTKLSSGLRRSASYTNISPPQNKNNGYENIFLEKYQTLSRLQIKPELGEQNILDKTVPVQKSPIYKSSNTKIASYVNISDVKFSGAKIPNKMNMKTSEFNKKKDRVENQVVSNSEIKSNNTMIPVSSKLTIDETNGDSIYGKIYKTSNNAQTNDKSNDIVTADITTDLRETRKKPMPSKKTERAPLPPNTKQFPVMNNEMPIKMSPGNSLIPKKLPSRKLEKAPSPPQLLQKSSSAMNVKKNLPSAQHYVNFPSPLEQEKHKLPALHENVTNTSGSPKVPTKKINSSVFNDKFVNRGLSHSQSDVSVYLALKERRVQSVNQERKILDMKSLLMNKKGKLNNESLNVSSSDSDSSYEKIYLTKHNEQVNTPKCVPQEVTENSSPRSYRKEVPVAPPRSKRRSTTEVQYTKVKAKNASCIGSTSQIVPGGNEMENSKASNSDGEPPAIPLKTKDAFEIPAEVLVTDMNKKLDEIKRGGAPNFKSTP